MIKLTKEKKEYIQKKYIDRYVLQKKEDNWKSYRSLSNFIKEEKEFSFLKKRNVYVPIENKNNLNLQESRGIGIDENTTIDAILEKIKNDINADLTIQNKIRMNEILGIVKANNIFVKNKNFLEIGFRIPKIQSFLEAKLGINGYGIDINEFNVELFLNLGYKVKCLDLNKENYSFFENKKFDIISCYHVLEHTYNPEIAIKNIFENMSKKSILHIEIPIENNKPKIELGHLIGFEEGELLNLLKQTGFAVIYGGKSKIHTSGECIERYIATKGY